MKKNIAVIVGTMLLVLVGLKYSFGSSNNSYEETKNELLNEIKLDFRNIDDKNQTKKVVEEKWEIARSVRVKLNSNSEVKKLRIYQNNKKPFYVSHNNSEKKIVDEFIIDFSDKNFNNFKAFSTENQFVLEGFDKSPSWNKNLNDNVFEGNIIINKDFDIINETTIEEYLRGMAEVPESSHNEKRKALAVAIRSYIQYYTSGLEEKFPGKDYNASDDPKIFQKYLGYNYSQRAKKWIEALKETEGEIILYNNEVLRTPYYSCTLPENARTLNPEEANWGKYFLERKEVFSSKEDKEGVDPNRSTREQCGHWVGMSGQGSEVRANNGWDYKKILKYYYSNIEIKKI